MFIAFSTRHMLTPIDVEHNLDALHSAVMLINRWHLRQWHLWRQLVTVMAELKKVSKSSRSASEAHDNV